jgi:hypothetical protein
MTHLGNLITDIKYMGMLARHALSKASLATYGISLPCHLGILLIILSITG